MESSSLKTIWTDSILTNIKESPYPRPQLKRDEWLCLNGYYEYAITGLEDYAMGDSQGNILVPFPIESKLSGVEMPLLPNQKLWYRKSFQVPDAWQGKRILLHFGAVDWQCTVYVNNAKVLEHTGGYYPFEEDITDCIRPGSNTLVLEVWDPTDTYHQERGKQVLSPSGMWYTPVSGIWQTVWLEPVPDAYIKSLRITPNIDTSTCSVNAICKHVKENSLLRVTAYEDDKIIAVQENSPNKTCTLNISSPRLWSPDDPYLYELKAELLCEDMVVDTVSSYFGMRKFSTGVDKEGIPRLMLNNKPIFMNGVLDQGYWPDGLYTAPCDEALEFDIKAVKSLGFNTIRKHIKVEPMRWYYHCDRLGVIVWQDMISGGDKLSNKTITLNGVKAAIGSKPKDNTEGFYKALGRGSESSRKNYEKELDELLDTLYSCVCIGLWTPFNEGWGQFNAREIGEYVKAKDPSRIVDHASGWFDQGGPDLCSQHIYFRKIKAPFKILGRPWVVSEYGGYNLRIKDHVFSPDKQYGYKNHKSVEELTAAYTTLMEGEVLPLVKKGLSGAIYTQITDVEEETNGFLTYDRKVMKMDTSTVYKLNRQISKSLK